ncbi:hypothetical protein BST61_g3721 [Cercospora zeina]
MKDCADLSDFGPEGKAASDSLRLCEFHRSIPRVHLLQPRGSFDQGFVMGSRIPDDGLPSTFGRRCFMLLPARIAYHRVNTHNVLPQPHYLVCMWTLHCSQAKIFHRTLVSVQTQIGIPQVAKIKECWLGHAIWALQVLARD